MPEHWFIWMFLLYLMWGSEKRTSKGWLDIAFIVSWVGCLAYGLVKGVIGA